jgi:hypothetical protein
LGEAVEGETTTLSDGTSEPDSDPMDTRDTEEELLDHLWDRARAAAAWGMGRGVHPSPEDMARAW